MSKAAQQLVKIKPELPENAEVSLQVEMKDERAAFGFKKKINLEPLSKVWFKHESHLNIKKGKKYNSLSFFMQCLQFLVWGSNELKTARVQENGADCKHHLHRGQK